MTISRSKTGLLALALMVSGTANADLDLGVGLKAGTLGLGLEATWQPLPYLDVRVGANAYEYEDDGTQAGVAYDGTLDLESFYATGNFHFPVSPMRLTAGLYSNGNEFVLLNDDAAGTIDIGGIGYPASEIGTLTSVTSFGSTSPYIGIGFDFTLAGKVGMNLDFGVLWQGEPDVTLEADGPTLPLDQGFQDALAIEREQLEDEMSDFKAWPVVSLGFVYNF